MEVNNNDGQNVYGSPLLVEAIIKLNGQIRDLAFFSRRAASKERSIGAKVIISEHQKTKEAAALV